MSRGAVNNCSTTRQGLLVTSVGLIGEEEQQVVGDYVPARRVRRRGIDAEGWRGGEEGGGTTHGLEVRESQFVPKHQQ